MKQKIIAWWHQTGAFIIILFAYAIATVFTIYGGEVARKTGSCGWLLFAILCGAILAFAIGVFYREFTIEELIGEEEDDD